MEEEIKKADVRFLRPALVALMNNLEWSILAAYRLMHDEFLDNGLIFADDHQIKPHSAWTKEDIIIASKLVVAHATEIGIGEMIDGK